MDLGLPGLDGLEVLRRMRQRGIRTPAIITTARDAVEDRISGFKAGADDYIVKSFALAELEQRISALLKRTHVESKRACGPLVMARDAHNA